MSRKRKEFPVAVKRQAAERSKGVCECDRMEEDIIAHFPKDCQRPAKEFDHIRADILDGDPTIENCAHLSEVCHKIKSALDAKYRARRNKHAINWDKPPKKDKPKTKMRSAGFCKTLTRPIPTKKNPRPEVRPRD